MTRHGPQQSGDHRFFNCWCPRSSRIIWTSHPLVIILDPYNVSLFQPTTKLHFDEDQFLIAIIGNAVLGFAGNIDVAAWLNP